MIANHPSSSLNVSRSKPPARIVKTVACQTLDKERTTSDVGVQVELLPEDTVTYKDKQMVESIEGLSETAKAEEGENMDKEEYGEAAGETIEDMPVSSNNEQEHISSLKRPASPLPEEELPLSKHYCADVVASSSSTPSPLSTSTSPSSSSSLTDASVTAPLLTSTCTSSLPSSTTPLPSLLPSSTAPLSLPSSTLSPPSSISVLPLSLPSSMSPLPLSLPSSAAPSSTLSNTEAASTCTLVSTVSRDLTSDGIHVGSASQPSVSSVAMSQSDSMPILHDVAPIDVSNTSLPHDADALLPCNDVTLPHSDSTIISSSIAHTSIGPLPSLAGLSSSTDQVNTVSLIDQTDITSLTPQPSLSVDHLPQSNFLPFTTAKFVPPQMATPLPMLPNVSSSDVLCTSKVDSLVLSSIQPAVIPSVPTVAELASGIQTSSAEVKIPENLTLPPTSPFFPILPSSPSTPGIENIDESELLATVTSELGVESIDPSLLNMSDLLSLIQTEDPCGVDELMLTGGEVPQELIVLQESSGTIDIGEMKSQLDISQEELLKDLPVELKETVQGILENQTDF